MKMIDRNECEWMLVSNSPIEVPVYRIVIDKCQDGCIAVAHEDEKDWFVSDSTFSTKVWANCEPIPKKKTRPMTNAEMRGFIANTPGIEFHHFSWTKYKWEVNTIFSGAENVSQWQYRTISLTGEPGEPKEFVVEVEE